ncbi:MAG: 6-bladed beta-propeller [Melioribacteraceae bacterium]|nr:6-bladed beta-propeller [Melioribacteraceae bacterium]MCF8396500.1 6-bladed beta-propeller [Melioribacteraceae bacterium]
MRYILIFSIGIIIFLGCNQEKENDGSNILLKKKFIETFEIYEEVTLEYSEESLISFPYDLCVSDSFYIIASRGNTIKLFDKSGKFKRSIGNIGRGPGEYSRITSIFKINNTDFGVYDLDNNKFIVYNCDNTLLEERKLEIDGISTIRNVVYNDNSYFIHFPFTEDLPYHIIKLDSNFKYENGIIKADLEYLDYTYRGLYEGGIFKDSESKYLYEINSFTNNNLFKIDLNNFSIERIALPKPEFYVPIEAADINSNHDETLKKYREGTSIFRIFQVGKEQVLVQYNLPKDNVVYIKSYVYNYKGSKKIELLDGKGIAFADDNFLYELRFSNLKSEKDSQVGNPIITLYAIREN